MRQLTPGEPLKERPVVTVGTFDGVHRGHQALLGRARTLAAQLGTTWAVLTFAPPPAVVLKRIHGPFELTPLAEKLETFDRLGVPLVGVLAFDQALSQLPADAFLSDVVEGWLHAQAIVEGDTFTFGAGARGNPVTLRAWGQRHGVAVEIVPRQGETVGGWSSSRAREALSGGHLTLVERILGRPYEASGTVEPGAGRGRRIGVPTANLALPASKLMPPPAVYAGFVQRGGESWPAVANWGPQPTFEGAVPRLEVHLLDFDGDLRGERLRFSFRERIRGIERFSGPDALVARIREDIETARRLLPVGPPSH
jgi:riboflavin kinase/FMN adenylyltransferase